MTHRNQRDSDDDRDEPVGMMTVFGLPAFIEDSPLTRTHGWCLVGLDPEEGDS